MTTFATHSQLVELIARLQPECALRIGGVATRAAATFPVYDPASGEIIAEVADGTVGDARDAVTAAAASLSAWSATAPRQRSEILRRSFDIMIEEREALALLISAENGKSLADATAEVTYAAEYFRWFSEEAVRIDGDFTSAPAGGARIVITSRPIGVAALITPWNFPAAMATRKLGAALAAGCTTVLRPASHTPLTAIALVDILERAGLPGGVVNLVTSARAADISSEWLNAPQVRAVSFTGSTPVGSLLLAQAAPRILYSAMELGGNAPFVVAADADIELAVRAAMAAKFRGGGQACTAANRFFVHESVAGEFTARLVAEVQQLRVGPAIDPVTQIGPMIDANAAQRIRGLVSEAVSRGGVIAGCVADIPTGDAFVAPTVLSGVQADDSILGEEIFGPVAPIVSFDDSFDLLAAVNSTEMGLAAYVISDDLDWALHFAEQIEAGMVGINRGVISDPAAPFGGVKASGLGREGGKEGIREYLETQYLSVAW